jgi:hypothetical protein
MDQLISLLLLDGVAGKTCVLRAQGRRGNAKEGLRGDHLEISFGPMLLLMAVL